MDIDILKLALEQQLENNQIKRGSKRAHDFEYAFICGTLAMCAAKDEKPPAYLVILAMTGRSLFDTIAASEEVH